MEAHFRAFTFVDRIHAVQPGAGIQGSYRIPPTLDTFSPALVAEAVGQLAAWSAMAVTDFTFRPVAGLAAEIGLQSNVRPGDVLELSAELESVDREAVAYNGSARVGGLVVLHLEHAVGPMLPTDEFDDPAALRPHFERLRANRVVPGSFRGLPAFPLEPCEVDPGRRLRAILRVPTSAAFFDDHFPRRAVFPGSLLMGCNLELARALAADLPGPRSLAERGRSRLANGNQRGDREGSGVAGDPAPRPPVGGTALSLGRRAEGNATVPGPVGWVARRVTDLKLRAFTAPGELLHLEARLEKGPTDSARVAVETRAGDRLIGSARVHLGPEARP